ncbi:MAG TPA: TolC family protein, partial [Alphaproteobacteria bacterium]|nr:TolC family protein [Alphaproteobacteria bacterium]
MAVSNRCKNLLRTGLKIVPVVLLLGVPAYAQDVEIYRQPPQAPAAAPAVPAPVVSDQLTMSQVLRMAYLNNPALNSGRADLLATQEELPQAQAGWKPSVTADADVTNNNSDDGDSDESNTSKGVGLSLTQPLYRGGRTMAQSASARAVIAARSQLLRAQEQDIFEAVAIAYMDVLRD